jgi:hypothetical protein
MINGIFGKILLSVVLLSAVCLSATAQTENKIVRKPILNGAATYLPKPEHPQEAKDFCAGGEVEVEILIAESGSVLSAKAISGDELLRDSSVKAVKKAKFRQIADGVPVKVKGIVVYNFDSFVKCINAGIVNNKALNIPKPQVANLNHPKHLQIREEQTVNVQIVVDESGKVIRARAVSGHPMLRHACEYSARQAKFPPTLVNPGPVKVQALLVYKFKPDGTVETNCREEEKYIVGKPINLPKPPFPSFNGKIGNSKPIILVQAEIDEEGNVVSATAISGHPALRQACVAAARVSKFSHTKIAGIPLRAKALISYQFIIADDVTVNVEVKNIEAKK